jgi:DUF1680 family protein
VIPVVQAGKKRIIPLQQTRITDKFWSGFTKLVRETVISYQWEALNDRVPEAEPSYAIRNFRIAAGLEEGSFEGFVFQDSDLAKWLEAVGYSLAVFPDSDLEKVADEAIDLIVAAQQEDGYLNTYFTVKEKGKRWSNLTDCHELYCAGHMMEAAVAYYKGTGKRKLLDAMCRFADYIDSVFGNEPGKLNGYDGHQEIELALVKLYEVTNNEKYLRLSEYFIEQRGQSPNFFEQEYERPDYKRHWSEGRGHKPDTAYHQAHVPVREQQVAIGHSVRAVYMYTAMADLARENGDASLLAACRRLWTNMVEKQMYITGGIGSTHHGEAFSFDYDLPNDTVYAETCASIGLIFFAQRMLQLEANSEYADVLERALYNLVIGSMAADGKHFFYVNPLEVWPEASRHNPGKRHVKPVRQRWFGCACCPPNLARLIASLGQYIYTVNEHTIYTHLYIGNETMIELGERKVTIKQDAELPWNGQVKLTVAPDQAGRFTLALRVPSWVRGGLHLSINGNQVHTGELVRDGYILLDREWGQADQIELNLPMEAEWMIAHPHIRADLGKAAIQRGPLVYCVEEVDNEQLLGGLSISLESKLESKYEEGFLERGAVVIETEGWRDDYSDSGFMGEYDADGHAVGGMSAGGIPYRAVKPTKKPVKLRAIPYYMWGNRGEGEMAVWLRVRS